MDSSLLHSYDYWVIFGYLILVATIGILVGRGQKSTDAYFLANRSMRWFPIGISTIASLFSAISYMGHPSEYFAHGLVYSIGPLAVFVAAPIVIRVFMPFYSSLKLSTAYEYLEKRFSVIVRTLASGMFIFWRLAWMATATYVPALVLHTVTGMPLIELILIVGVGATAYTVMGGIRAVIWTDVMQFFVLFGGTALAVLIVLSQVGSLSEIWAIAEQGNRTQIFDWSLDPWQRLTTWGVLIGAFVTYLGFWGADHVSVQRFLTARSLRDMQTSLMLTAGLTMVIHVLLVILGLSLFAFYTAHPQLLPGDLPGDRVYPYFVARQMPIGVSGLLIAAILAAAMSSIDSGLNACTSAIMTDFVRRFRWFARSQASITAESTAAGELARLKWSRLVTLGLGVVIILLASFVERLGTIIEITNTLTNSFAGPMLGLFLLGMLTRRATSRGVVLGLAAGSLITLYFMFYTAISFRLYGLIGLIATLAVGYVASLISGDTRKGIDDFVFSVRRSSSSSSTSSSVQNGNSPGRSFTEQHEPESESKR